MKNDLSHRIVNFCLYFLVFVSFLFLTGLECKEQNTLELLRAHFTVCLKTEILIQPLHSMRMQVQPRINTSLNISGLLIMYLPGTFIVKKMHYWVLYPKIIIQKNMLLV